MRAILVTLALGLAFTAAAPAPASADHCGEGVAEEVCVTGQGSGFDVEGQELPDPDDAGSVTVVRQPDRPASRTYVDRNYVPTCTGNTAFDGGTLCNAAVQTCPEPKIRFWIFEATIVRATRLPEPGSGYKLVGTVCRAPNDPEIDPAVALPGLVQREFKNVVVLSGRARVSPAPRTLVNVRTRFQTDAVASYTIPLTLLNRPVVITATARRYTWTLGEGNRRSSTRANGYLEYSYKTAGRREVHVDIEWSGTFSVNGGPSQPITGTVTTDGPPTTIQVQQARSELVRD